jgi:hypothetical protein
MIFFGVRPVTKSFKVINRSAVLGLTVSLMAALTGGQQAMADSCFLSPAKLSDDATTAFKDNPGALLAANPVGGYGLTTQVRSLAGSDTDSLSTIVGLAGSGNPEQVTSIGAGLAQAATACVNLRPDIAAQIQQAVAASGNDALIAAFAAATGNTQTAAVGGVGGGAGGGAGAGGIGGGGAGAGGAGAGGGGTSTTTSNTGFSLATSGGTSSVSTTTETTTGFVSPN